MMDHLTITAEDLKKFAPKAKPEYVTALLGGIYQLRTAGILENERRLCHFMAQCGHETGGFTIVRESLHYTKAERLRTVWPSRFRSKTNAELAPLLKDGRKLGDAVYLGRMGNTQSGDGWEFRGGGFLQTTGRGAVTSYCTRLGLDPSSSLLDDPTITLQFACLEWADSQCNTWADENDLTKVCKAINTGSAQSGIKPVDMTSRQEWFAKAWSIWGGKGKPDAPAEPPPTTAKILATSSTPAAVGAGGLALAQSPPDLSALAAWKTAAMDAGGMIEWATSNWKLSAAAGGTYVVLGHVLPWWQARRT